MECRNSAPHCPDPAGASDVSAFFPVSRLQAKYKGFLGKRAYQKKRKAGTGSGVGDSLRAGLSTGAGALRSPKPVGLWAALGAVGVRGGGSCTQSTPRAFYRGSFGSVWILTPRTVGPALSSTSSTFCPTQGTSWGTWGLILSCGSSSEQQQQHLLSHTRDILGHLGVDPQLLGEKPLLAQQADIKCSFLGCGQGQQEAEQGQGLALMLSPTAQVGLDPPWRGKHSELAVPTS